MWIRTKWDVSSLEQIDRWLGTSTKNTKFFKNISQMLISFTWKNPYLQSAYILLYLYKFGIDNL